MATQRNISIRDGRIIKKDSEEMEVKNNLDFLKGKKSEKYDL